MTGEATAQFRPPGASDARPQIVDEDFSLRGRISPGPKAPRTMLVRINPRKVAVPGAHILSWCGWRRGWR